MGHSCNMAVEEISRKQFDSFSPPRSTIVQTITEELSWYGDTDRRIIGAVLFDKTNMDWAYVVLGRERGGEFNAVKTETCLETKEEAEALLISAMQKIEASGKTAFIRT